MPRKQSQAYYKPRRSKNRVNNKTFCNVCYTFQATELFSTKYCSSLVPHRKICEKCVHQHIVSTLNSCLVNSVTCLEHNCGAIISSSVIHDILLKYNNHDLLNNYLREKNWNGKSEEWIERFTLPCPGCKVPIQKNGGCNRMVCSRCKKRFLWEKERVAEIYFFIGCFVPVAIMFLVYITCVLILNKK